MQNELSDRELTVLDLATKGYTDEMIARELGLKQGTVNSYWVRIRGKLGNFSRTELAARFIQQTADVKYTAQEERQTNEAAELANKNQRLLDKASAEIARLKRRIAELEDPTH